MRNRIQLALVIAAAVFVGAGIAQLFAHTHAEAQQRQWRECFSASLWPNDGAAMASPRFRPRTVAVPPGWVPVGGGGNDHAYAVVLCR